MENKLEHLDEFKALLNNYKVSEDTKSILKSTDLIILVSTSGTGRNTVIDSLVKLGKYHFIVSDTTRKPRVNNGVTEKDGEHYWFKSENDFIDGLRAGEYLEAAIIHNQQVSGVSINELKKARDDSLIAIAEIDYQGAEKVEALKPEACLIFLLPPNFNEWLDRLVNRGKLSEEELRRRLESASVELEHAITKGVYTFVINTIVENCAKLIHKICSERIVDTVNEKEGLELAKKLKSDLDNYLNGNS